VSTKQTHTTDANNSGELKRITISAPGNDDALTFTSVAHMYSDDASYGKNKRMEEFIHTQHHQASPYPT